MNFATRRRLTLAGGAALAIIAVFGASRLRVWHNPLSWIPTDKYIRTAFDEVDEHMGGVGAVQILMEGTTPRGVKDVDVMNGLEQLLTHIQKYRDPDTGKKVVGNAISVMDPVRETHRALHGGKQEAFRIPENQQELTDAFTLFENAGPDELGRLMTLDGSMALVNLRTRWLEATSYGPLTAHITEGIDRFMPKDKVKMRVTGSVYNLFSTVSLLLRDLLRSFGVAFAVITVLMVFMLQSLKLGMVAMIPNLVPIMLILGIMGFLGIPIDMANLLIGSIALGVAVDDTIHFLYHYKVHYAATGNVDRSIAAALLESGRAMAATSVILCFGFFTYLGATMFSIQRFGFLIGTTVIFALLIDLIGCPALLRTLYAPPKSQSSNVGEK